jgi:hypothetical protein
MAITKRIEVDKLEVVGIHRHVQVRTATVIEEDGVELSRSFHRHVVSPTDDYSGETDEVKAVCEAVFTAEVVEAYELSQSAQVDEAE